MLENTMMCSDPVLLLDALASLAMQQWYIETSSGISKLDLSLTSDLPCPRPVHRRDVDGLEVAVATLSLRSPCPAYLCPSSHLLGWQMLTLRRPGLQGSGAHWTASACSVPT